MAKTPQGLLFVFAQCEPDISTKDFNDWYDDEHVPARLTIPGITSATRYKAINKETPEWLAIYDLDGPEVLKTQQYVALRDAASDNEKSIIQRLPILQRRIYSFITQSVKPDIPPTALPGKYALVVLWSIPEEHDTAFHRWYDEEHMADISKTPGWLRGRRFRLLEAADLSEKKGPPFEGWNYAVIHDYEKSGFVESTEFITAVQTPWSKEVISSHAKAIVMRQFELYRNFEINS